MSQNESNRVKISLSQNDTRWAKRSQKDSKLVWVKNSQIESKWVKLSQIESKWVKRVKNKSKYSNLINIESLKFIDDPWGLRAIGPPTPQLPKVPIAPRVDQTRVGQRQVKGVAHTRHGPPTSHINNFDPLEGRGGLQGSTGRLWGPNLDLTQVRQNDAVAFAKFDFLDLGSKFLGGLEGSMVHWSILVQVPKDQKGSTESTNKRPIGTCKKVFKDQVRFANLDLGVQIGDEKESTLTIETHETPIGRYEGPEPQVS